MCISITKVFLAILILLFQPIFVQAQTESKNNYQAPSRNIKLFFANQFLLTKKQFPQYTLLLTKSDKQRTYPHALAIMQLRELASLKALTNNETALHLSLFNSFNSLPSNLILETQPNILSELEVKQIVEQIVTFKPGVASRQTFNKLGVLELNGNFNSPAQLIKGKASWKSETILELLDVLINVDQQISLLDTATTWNTNTALGTVAIKGNLNQDLTFNGANATWNADTPMGSLFVKGNITQTSFTGGKVKVATNALIGSFKADLKIDHETHFSGANASWDANLPFSSNIKIDGSFDQKKTFTGGSIKFGTKSTLGNLGIKANLDRHKNLTSGSAFWEAQAGLGSIILNADLNKDGSYNSELSIHFPL